jgi:RHS repeat-associated protein
VEREPFGARYAVRTGAARYQPLAFPGQEEDASTDRSYNIFRWYRSVWGRYTQGDPLEMLPYGSRVGSNRLPNQTFGYADANPVLRLDVDGLSPCKSCATCPSGIWRVDPLGPSASFSIGFWGRSITRATYTCMDNALRVDTQTICKIKGQYSALVPE